MKKTQVFERHKPTLFFDFDGTLADTVKLNFKIFNQLSSLYRHRKITEEQMLAFRDLHVADILKEMNIGVFRKVFLVTHARLVMSQHIEKVKPFPGLFSTLEPYQSHFNFSVVSTNSRKNIEIFLRQHSPFNFNFILGGLGIFRKGHALKTLLKQQQLNPKNCFYVGDELRDIDLSRFCNIHSVAVSWGCNSKKALVGARPDHLIDTTNQLEQLLLSQINTKTFN